MKTAETYTSLIAICPEPSCQEHQEVDPNVEPNQHHCVKCGVEFDFNPEDC